jgi:dipeptidyl aminopeptidase/acylaminoacyl peptidase
VTKVPAVVMTMEFGPPRTLKLAAMSRATTAGPAKCRSSGIDRSEDWTAASVRTASQVRPLPHLGDAETARAEEPRQFGRCIELVGRLTYAMRLSVTAAAVGNAAILAGAAPAVGESKIGWIVAWGGPAPSVYAIRADGSGLRRLTRFAANAKRGDVSPNGRIVVFDGGPQQGGSTADFDVQVIRVDGRGRHTIAGTPSREIDARFSPDGRWITYTKESTRAVSSVWVTTLDGRNRRRLGSGGSARWSPDGRHLFFARSDGGQLDLYTMSSNGTHVSRLTRTIENEEPAAWSPDGRQLLFTRDGSSSGIYVMAVGSRRVRRLTASGQGEIAGAWSPDGSWIAFTRRSRVFAMRSDGTHSRQLSTNAIDLEATAWVRTVR